MKKYIISLLLVLLMLPDAVAQDARGRVTSTIVADALAMLPAAKRKAYDEAMADLASTGSEGIQQLASMLVPADQGKNSTVEYALYGVTAYVMAPGRDELRDGVRDGLKKAIGTVTDNANRAFLMTLLQNCGRADDADFFASLATDPYLADWAINGLISIDGSEQAILKLIEDDAAPRSELARAAGMKNVTPASINITAWLADPTTDAKTRRACYKALGQLGQPAAEPVLFKAARTVKFAGAADGGDGSTEAYIDLLHNFAKTGKAPAASQAAHKLLAATTRPNIKGAALNIIFDVDGKKSQPLLLQAMKSNDRHYRVNALRRSEPWADASTCAELNKILAAKGNDAAKADIINWYGATRNSAAIIPVVANINAVNEEVALAAIKAAGMIGGDDALNALTSALSGKYADDAAASLLRFNGNVAPAIIKALDADPVTCRHALAIASKRKMSQAAPKVFELTRSTDNDVADAAYDALAGVVKENDFATLASMLEADKGHAPQIVAAMKSALIRAEPSRQFETASAAMSKAAKPYLYFPLLSQAGNSEAVARLLDGYSKTGDEKAAAFEALLQVDSPDMIEVMYGIAAGNGQDSEKALNRYADLVARGDFNPVKKYQYYRRGLELNTSDNLRNKMLKSLGSTNLMQAGQVAAPYMDNAATAKAAAGAVRSVASKNNMNLGGKDMKAALEKAREVFRNGTTADDGYAVDDINGMLANLPAEGFVNVTANGDDLSGDLENFELMFEWKGRGHVMLRSVPDAYKVGCGCAPGSKVRNADGQWNTTYIKVVNDRITVVENGEIVIDNATLTDAKNPDSPVAASGKIGFSSSNPGFEVRDIYLRQLPSTPVFELSADEAADGFKVLFDGRSMHNFTGNKIDYVPVDGNIYVTAAYGNGGNLYTVDEFSDFILRFDFCFEREGVNNGVGIRTPMNVDAAYEGMEIQILDHDAPIYKNLRDYQVHGSVYGIIPAKRIKHQPLGKWSTEEIRAVGDHITVTVNGEVILDGDIRVATQGHNVAPDGSTKNPYTVDKKNHPGLFNKSGHIGFLGHGAGIKLRNIRIKDLSSPVKKNRKK